jgi:hypothetical protein
MYQKIRKNKRVNGLKWTACVILILELMLTSFNIYPLNLYFMVIGTFLWIMIAFLWKETSLMILNIMACLIGLTGIVNSWI